MLSFLLSLFLVTQAHAITYETSNWLERGTFETVPLSGTISIDDVARDYTIFYSDAKDQPPILADLKKVTVTTEDKGWLVHFVTHETIPADPGMPVNFHVYIDRADIPNATTGVMRAQSDMIVMLLFGTKTKWHAEWWTYDQKSAKWLDQTISIPYTKANTDFTLTIPYTVLPRDTKATIRFLALADNNAGINETDIAPGTYLPETVATKEEPPALPPSARKTATATPANYANIILMTAVFITIGGGIVWLMRKK